LPEYNVINRGFGGSRLVDLLYYTDRIVIPYQPRIIVVNEGGNDLHSGRTPEQLMTDFKAFVEKVHAALPNTRIIMSGLTPSPSRWSEVDVRKKTNQMLREYIATKNFVTYVDLFDAYLGPDGKPNDAYFVADHLHHSAAGYQVRLKYTRPLLGEPDKK